jgi:hypothetical protein
MTTINLYKDLISPRHNPTSNIYSTLTRDYITFFFDLGYSGLTLLYIKAVERGLLHSLREAEGQKES